MWKYIGTKECNEFLLSLNLINCKDDKKYIKTIYSISNNIEKNYKIYFWVIRCISSHFSSMSATSLNCVRARSRLWVG